MTLALMKSIIKKNSLSAADCSKTYGSHYLQRPSRGYGKSAQKALRALGTNTENHLTSGKIDNEEGSWGNGGAMRISPVGLCFRNADLSIVKKVATSIFIQYGAKNRINIQTGSESGSDLHPLPPRRH